MTARKETYKIFSAGLSSVFPDDLLLPQLKIKLSAAYVISWERLRDFDF